MRINAHHGAGGGADRHKHCVVPASGVRGYVRASVRAWVRGCVRENERANERVCLCSCVRACVHACARMSECECMRASVR